MAVALLFLALDMVEVAATWLTLAFTVYFDPFDIATSQIRLRGHYDRRRAPGTGADGATTFAVTAAGRGSPQQRAIAWVYRTNALITDETWRDCLRRFDCVEAAPGVVMEHILHFSTGDVVRVCAIDLNARTYTLQSLRAPRVDDGDEARPLSHVDVLRVDPPWRYTKPFGFEGPTPGAILARHRHQTSLGASGAAASGATADVANPIPSANEAAGVFPAANREASRRGVNGDHTRNRE